MTGFLARMQMTMKTVVNRSSKNLLNMFPPEPIALQKRTAAAEAAFPLAVAARLKSCPSHFCLPTKYRTFVVTNLLHVAQTCEAVVDDSL